MATKKVEKKYCIHCIGKQKRLKPLTDFYASKESPDGHVDLCKKCYFEMALNEDGSINEKGFKEALRLMNKPYDETTLNSAIERANMGGSKFSNIAANYMRMCNSLPQISDCTFTDSVVKATKNNVEKENKKLANKINKKEVNEKEVVWDKRDLQNKKYVIETFGYDPFADSIMTEKDRKNSYNILSGYCDTDGIKEDGHKMQAIITMTSNIVQSRHVDDLINEEYAKENPDHKKVKDLTGINKSLADQNAKIASDNNISAKTNKNAKQGANSLTSKMKEMEENGIFDYKVNMIDIKTSEAYEKLNLMSMKNIMSQIIMGDNEWSSLLKESYEFNTDLQKKNDELFEENRNVKNENIRLKKLLKEAGIDYGNN